VAGVYGCLRCICKDRGDCLGMADVCYRARGEIIKQLQKEDDND